MSQIDAAIAFLLQHDKLDEYLALQRLIAACETLNGLAQGEADNLPDVVADGIDIVMQEIAGLNWPREPELPPAADDPIPLPTQVPLTDVRGRNQKLGKVARQLSTAPYGSGKERKRPKFKIVKGGKSD